VPSPAARLNHLGGGAQSNLGPKAERQFIARVCQSRCRDESYGLVCSVNVKLSGSVADVAANDISSAFLEVDFGGGDSDESAFAMDLINGTSFPAIGGCNVFLNYPKTDATQPNIDVSVSVGKYEVGAQAALGCRRTIKARTVNGTSAILPIPKFAVQAVYANTAIGVAAAQFDQLRAPVVGAAILSTLNLGKTQATSVPIINGARGFQLTVANSTGDAVIFNLSPA